LEQQKKVPVISPTDGKVQRYVDYSDFIKSLNFANLAQIRIRNLETNRDSNPTYNKYTKSQIVTYLENPANYEKQLRQMSIYLYNISNYYRRLVNYFATMSTYSYIVTSYGIDFSKNVNMSKYKKAYYNATSFLEKMNVAHEFSKALIVAFREDVFYGYAWETTDSFAFQKLDADYCKISSIEDGVYNFAFNFSYFDSNAEKLPNYAPEFTTMYQLYKANSSTAKWQELDPEKSICLKVNEHDYIPVPPFVSLFSALADIEDYRAISKDASEINNYKALALEIPLDDEGHFLLDKDLAEAFYNQMCNVLPSNIGAILTPMKISSWDFEKSGVASDSDEVSKSEATMWSEAGVNKILFGGGEDPSASTLELCTVNDQMICFNMMRQIERWINRRLKSIGGAVKFKIKILDVTQFNREAMHAKYLKDGQYGLPVRMAIMATEGYSPSDTENMTYLENTVLKLYKKEVPLTSSNTQSGAVDEVGRPTNAEDGKGLSDSGNTSADRKET